MQETISLSIDTAEDLLSQYQCPSDGFDEMCVTPQQIRPHWEYLIRSLKTLGREELERRCQESRELLRDNGVTYNVYGDPQGRDRPWQLDPIPLLFSSEEWSSIERGLIQRAELMNLLLEDLYGARETLRKGLIPVELVAVHPGFLRPCHGMEMDSRHRLPLYAVELVRAPDGGMWALADRTQAPSGAGYALENRVVLSRVIPSLFRDSHVHRLALFFRTLRLTLASMARSDDPRIVLLTPGPLNETYFEHAYLANYLGYTLVQSTDLTVRDSQVFLKTLDGLQPVDVILRRVADHLCDPLELHPESLLGVAGLLQAIRVNRVTVANPLGSSVLENPALFSFLPALSKYFLGEELAIPSPATWWCGQRKTRDYVLANLDKLVIKQIAQSSKSTSIRGKLLSNKQREMLASQIRSQPYLYIGTEEIPRSTMPVFANGRLESRHFLLRSFLVRGENSYVVMPGGLTRVATSSDTPVLSSPSGGISKDTWVLASEPEKQVTLFTEAKQMLKGGESQGELPSRVAENLFWLGRYAERAEGTIRLLRNVLLYLVEPFDFPTPQNHSCLPKLLRAVTYLTDTYPGFVGKGSEGKIAQPEKELLSVFLDKGRVGSLSATLQSLLTISRSVRDRVSPDMWRVINDIEEELQVLQRGASIQSSDALAELDKLITALAAFSGLSAESMTHGQGWRFLMIGRRIERALHVVQLLRATLSKKESDDAAVLEHILNITDSLLTYRRRYRSKLQVNATLELILQDEGNPRAIGFQLERIHKYIRCLPRKEDNPYRRTEDRLILEALTLVRLADVNTLGKMSKEDNYRKELDQLLSRLQHLLPELSDAINNSYFAHAERPRQLVQLGNEPE